jgi:phosphoadenosine phosphosulfate reductase
VLADKINFCAIKGCNQDVSVKSKSPTPAIDDELLIQLNAGYEKMTPTDILADALGHSWFARPVIVTSFGAEAVVLLHMASRVKPDIPVIFIDTGKLFGETLRYRDRLQHVLGLEDVRSVGPRQSEIEKQDPMGLLNQESPDLCCDIRKTKVLARALTPFSSWINGRKRHQSETRNNLHIIEAEDGRIKLTPLANWTAQALKDYIIEQSLPMHPLVKQGYTSIGCFPCTSKITHEGDARSGRWPGRSKTECGIHAKSTD